jgi:hypothetical protein
MDYHWTPTARRSATTDPNLVARPGPARGGAATTGRTSGPIVVAAAAGEFLEAAATGAVLNRSGRPYRPSALRDLRGCLEHHVLPALGELTLPEVRRRDVQALVDTLGDGGLSESRIRSVVSALRALYGWAIEQGHADHNPADALVMPRADEPAGSPAEESSWAEAGRVVEERVWGWKNRLGDLWDDRPTWDQPGGRDDGPRREDRSGPRDERRGVCEDRAGAARGRTSRAPEWSRADVRPRGAAARTRGPRDRGGYEPISLVPERILTLALRVTCVLFALIVLASLLESV